MLRAIVSPFLVFQPLLRRVGVCGNAGFIAGGVAGFFLTLLALLYGGSLTLTAADVLKLALVLGLAAWLLLIAVFVAFLRYSLASVARPTLLNAFLVALFTVLITNALGLFMLAWLIGLIVGLALGALLCVLYKRLRG